MGQRKYTVVLIVGWRDKKVKVVGFWRGSLRVVDIGDWPQNVRTTYARSRYNPQRHQSHQWKTISTASRLRASMCWHLSSHSKVSHAMNVIYRAWSSDRVAKIWQQTETWTERWSMIDSLDAHETKKGKKAMVAKNIVTDTGNLKAALQGSLR